MQTYRVIILIVAVIGLLGNVVCVANVLSYVTALKKRRKWYGSYRTDVIEHVVNAFMWAGLQLLFVFIGVVSVLQISLPLVIRTLFLFTSLAVTLRSFNELRAAREWSRQWNEENRDDAD